MSLLDELNPSCPRGCGRTMDDCHEQEEGGQCAGGELLHEKEKLEREFARLLSDYERRGTELADAKGNAARFKNQLKHRQDDYRRTLHDVMECAATVIADLRAAMRKLRDDRDGLIEHGKVLRTELADARRRECTALCTDVEHERDQLNIALAEARRERDEALEAVRFCTAVLRDVDPVITAAKAWRAAWLNDGVDGPSADIDRALIAAVDALPSAGEQIDKSSVNAAESSLDGAGQTDEAERSGIHTWGYAACRHPECLRAKAELTASASAPAEDDEPIDLDDLKRRAEALAPGVTDQLHNLLGCTWGNTIALKGFSDDQCPSKATQVVVLHQDGIERAFKLCGPHAELVKDETTPHESAASVSAPAEKNTPHRWTSHGHTCCPSAPLAKNTRPAAVARCGGPGLCKVCAVEAAQIHTAPAEETA